MSQSRGGRFVAAIAVLALMIGLGGGEVQRRGVPDSDGDGLPDEVEVLGWKTSLGETYRTDPELADSDGDGLTDRDEAGPRGEDDDAAGGPPFDELRVFTGYSDPLVPDTDGDELGDADEADLGVDPYKRDTDGDDIEDGREFNLVGTSPSIVDSDGDGFDDGYEDADLDDRGLDPLLVDVKISTATYATDFAVGLVFGDAWRKDSAAWLAGYLVSSGSSSIPGVGWVFGPAADVRDAVASAIRGDWVGSGFSALGTVPYAGDAVSMPAKVGEFVLRNRELAAVVAASVMASSKIPRKVKVQAGKQVFKQWDKLKDEGASEDALLRLAEGRTDLDDLGQALEASGHVEGAPADFLPSSRDGEQWLAELEGATEDGADREVRFSTSDCKDVCNETGLRKVDVLVDGVAHEARVGYTQLVDDVERQIRSDAHLVNRGLIDGAHWHFLASGHTNQMGAEPEIFELLDELDISYTIHLPA